MVHLVSRDDPDTAWHAYGPPLSKLERAVIRANVREMARVDRESCEEAALEALREDGEHIAVADAARMVGMFYDEIWERDYQPPF